MLRELVPPASRTRARCPVTSSASSVSRRGSPDVSKNRLRGCNFEASREGERPEGQKRINHERHQRHESKRRRKARHALPVFCLLSCLWCLSWLTLFPPPVAHSRLAFLLV